MAKAGVGCERPIHNRVWERETGCGSERLIHSSKPEPCTRTRTVSPNPEAETERNRIVPQMTTRLRPTPLHARRNGHVMTVSRHKPSPVTANKRRPFPVMTASRHDRLLGPTACQAEAVKHTRSHQNKARGRRAVCGLPPGDRSPSKLAHTGIWSPLIPAAHPRVHTAMRSHSHKHCCRTVVGADLVRLC